MRQFYSLINDRASKHIPDDRPFKEAFPNYTDWCVIWYRVAEEIRDDFLQEGLTESAATIESIIRESLSSAWHDKDRHIIVKQLKHDYKLAVDTL